MRWDQVSGWELMAAQVVVLAVVAGVLWAIGTAFQRFTWGRWLILVLAPVAGVMAATGLLNTDEAAVSAYLFALVVFMMGTVGMAVLLLAAIPQTRMAAIGGLVVGTLLVVSFLLTY